MDVKHESRGVDEKTRAEQQQLPVPSQAQPQRHTTSRLKKAWAINLLFAVYCVVSYTVKTYQRPEDTAEYRWALDVARSDATLSADKVEEIFLYVECFSRSCRLNSPTIAVCFQVCTR